MFQDESFEEPYIRNVFFPVDVFDREDTVSKELSKEQPVDDRLPVLSTATQCARHTNNTRIVESLNISRRGRKMRHHVPSSSFCYSIGEKSADLSKVRALAALNRSKYGLAVGDNNDLSRTKKKSPPVAAWSGGTIKSRMAKLGTPAAGNGRRLVLPPLRGTVRAPHNSRVNNTTIEKCCGDEERGNGELL